MLHLLSDALNEAREMYGEQLRLAFYNRGPESRLLVYRTDQDVAGGLELSGAEAISMLNELGDDGYLRLDYGKLGPNVGVGIVTVRFLEKGRAAIKQLPDPNKELLEVLDALVAAIEGLEDVDPADKEQAIDGANRLRKFLDNLPPGIAVEVLSRLATVLGAPGG